MTDPLEILASHLASALETNVQLVSRVYALEQRMRVAETRAYSAEERISELQVAVIELSSSAVSRTERIAIAWPSGQRTPIVIAAEPAKEPPPRYGDSKGLAARIAERFYRSRRRVA